MTDIYQLTDEQKAAICEGRINELQGQLQAAEQRFLDETTAVREEIDQRQNELASFRPSEEASEESTEG